MVLASLKEAAGLLKERPVLWLAGALLGCYAALSILVQAFADPFYTQPLTIFQLLLLPFLIGGLFGVIKEGTSTLPAFFQAGARHYFSVLLPSLVIIFAAVLTIFLLAFALMIPGIPVGEEILGFMMFGVLGPFIFFTFFYDTAAVLEGRKVFDSIRRSVEFVLNNAGKVILFYIANILILLGVAFAGIIVWTLLLAGRLEPLTGMTPAEIQELMPQDILSLVGAEGIMITAVVYALVALVSTAILYTYKACFFRRLSDGSEAFENDDRIGGEYDEKGRWYKY